MADPLRRFQLQRLRHRGARLLTPVYDVERFGIINTGNPKHADIFLLTGGINEQNKGVVRQIYDQMPKSPKVVIAIGICARRPEASSGSATTSSAALTSWFLLTSTCPVAQPGQRPSLMASSLVWVCSRKRAAMLKGPAAAVPAVQGKEA